MLTEAKCHCRYKADSPSSLFLNNKERMAESEDDIKKLRQLLKSTLETRQADLSDLLQHGSLGGFAEAMFSARLITQEVNKQPEFKHIFGSFIALMNFQKTKEKLEEHCCKLLCVLEKMRIADEVAQQLEETWTESALRQLDMTLNFDKFGRSKKPQQARQRPQHYPVYQGTYQSPVFYGPPQINHHPAVFKGPPPVPPKGSYNLQKCLRRDPQFHQTLTNKIQKERGKMRLSDIWPGEATPTRSHQLPQQQQASPTNSDVYSYLNTTQSTKDEGNSSWSSWQRTPYSSINGGALVMAGDEPKFHLTDPYMMTARGERPDPYEEHYSEVIPGSDIELPLSSNGSAVPSRSSTADTVIAGPFETPLVNEEGQFVGTHPLSGDTPSSHPQLNSNERPHPSPLNDGSPEANDVRKLSTSTSSNQLVNRKRSVPQRSTRPHPQDGSKPHPMDLATPLSDKPRPQSFPANRSNSKDRVTSSLDLQQSEPEEVQENEEETFDHREMVPGSSSSHMPNTTAAASLATEQELTRIKARVLQLETSQRNYCNRLCEECHQKDLQIIKLESELKEKETQLQEKTKQLEEAKKDHVTRFEEVKKDKNSQLCEVKVALAIMFLLFVITVIAGGVVMAMITRMMKTALPLSIPVPIPIPPPPPPTATATCM